MNATHVALQKQGDPDHKWSHLIIRELTDQPIGSGEMEEVENEQLDRRGIGEDRNSGRSSYFAIPRGWRDLRDPNLDLVRCRRRRSLCPRVQRTALTLVRGSHGPEGWASSRWRD